jgi:hypothetical protein
LVQGTGYSTGIDLSSSVNCEVTKLAQMKSNQEGEGEGGEEGGEGGERPGSGGGGGG